MNARMTDDEGDLLGVCGIGTQMAENMQLSSYGSLANIYDGMYLVNIGQDSIKEIKSVFEDNVHIFDEKNQKVIS